MIFNKDNLGFYEGGHRVAYLEASWADDGNYDDGNYVMMLTVVDGTGGATYNTHADWKDFFDKLADMCTAGDGCDCPELTEVGSTLPKRKDVEKAIEMLDEYLSEVEKGSAIALENRDVTSMIGILAPSLTLIAKKADLMVLPCSD